MNTYGRRNLRGAQGLLPLIFTNWYVKSPVLGYIVALFLQVRVFPDTCAIHFLNASNVLVNTQFLYKESL